MHKVARDHTFAQPFFIKQAVATFSVIGHQREQRLQYTHLAVAENAVYSYPRGNTTVTGPTIRLAEMIVQAMGNMDCGTVELERKPAVGNVPG